MTRVAIDIFLDHTYPELRQYFSHIISQDDVSMSDEGYLIKDCSVLLGDRDLSEILVVETDENSVD